jgi:hypothetical protein
MQPRFDGFFHNILPLNLFESTVKEKTGTESPRDDRQETIRGRLARKVNLPRIVKVSSGITGQAVPFNLGHKIEPQLLLGPLVLIDELAPHHPSLNPFDLVI